MEGRKGSRDKDIYLVLDCCWKTSRRVLICSETTPAARKPAQARPAPRPKRRVRVEAIQSVESGVEVAAAGLGLGLGGGVLVTWARLRVGVVGGLDVIVGGGCMDWVCDGGGVGGVGGEEEEAERWSLESGWEGEPKMAAMSTTVSVPTRPPPKLLLIS